VRTATNGAFGMRMHIRDKLSEPQRMLQSPASGR
jgi:hypothetical protein